MSQFFLSFPDEAEAIKQLAQWHDEVEGWIISGQDHAMWIVGDVYISPETTKYGEQDYPALKAEVVAKISAEQTKKVAAIASAELADVSAEELQAIQDAPILVKSSGFHVNLICVDEDLSEETRTYLVNPQFPKVVWL